MVSIKNNFIKRSISALFITAVTFFALVWSLWTYFFLFFYVVMLAMLEFYKLIRQAQVTPMRRYGVVLGLLCYTASFAYYYLGDYLSPLWGYMAVPLLVWMPVIALYRRKFSNPFVDIATTILGILYTALPCSMLHHLAFFKGYYSSQLTLGLLLIVWSQDVGAYLIGSMIGRTKLFERISPNKTWEGAIGGSLCALIAGYTMTHFLHIIPLGQWMAIAVITIFTGTYGDLVASLLKRSVVAKHTGNAIPGHGGFLDRVDSLLLTIPTVVAFLKISSLWN